MRVIPVSPGSFRALPAGVADVTMRAAVQPLRVVSVDPRALVPAGEHYNASLAWWNGMLVMAYRTGYGGSRCHLTQLDPETLEPRRSNRTLRWEHPAANLGQEDPRLFVHDGALWVSCTSFGAWGDGNRTSICILRLGQNFRVEEVIAPEYAARQAWEKNWVFFDFGYSLCCVYSVSPHVVLWLDGDTAEKIAEEHWSPMYRGGVMRGGASPVLVHGEYYHWFHGVIRPPGEHARYTVGLYTFSPSPPFRPLRYSPDPMAWPDEANRQANGNAALYPAGAVLLGDRWVVSCGRNDRDTLLFEFDRGEVEKALVTA